MSVALEVCRMAEERVGLDTLGLISALALEVGDQSGVEPANLEFCLDVLLGQPPFRGAKVVMSHTPGDALRLDYIEIDDERASH
jgi:Zn finger protein HypA/HybF involved in hydrogenase expression